MSDRPPARRVQVRADRPRTRTGPYRRTDGARACSLLTHARRLAIVEDAELVLSERVRSIHRSSAAAARRHVPTRRPEHLSPKSLRSCRACVSHSVAEWPVYLSIRCGASSERLGDREIDRQTKSTRRRRGVIFWQDVRTDGRGRRKGNGWVGVVRCDATRGFGRTRRRNTLKSQSRANNSKSHAAVKATAEDVVYAAAAADDQYQTFFPDKRRNKGGGIHKCMTSLHLCPVHLKMRARRWWLRSFV